MNSKDIRDKKNTLLTEARELVDADDFNEERYNEVMAEAEKEEKRAVMVEALEVQEAKQNESRGRVYQPEQPELPKDEKRGYSMLRAINCLANGRRVDGLEGEISQELSLRNGKDTVGFLMPMDTRANELDSTTGTGSASDIRYGSMIDLLRNKSVVMQAGASVLPNMEGAATFSMPKQTGANTAYWITTESADGTTNNQTIGSVTMTPNTLSAGTEISRRFLKTASIDAEQFVKNDLAAVTALAIDAGALVSDGTTAPFTGVLNNSNTNLVTVGDGTNGARVLYSDLFQLEKEIAVDNAEFGGTSFVTGPKLRAALKSTDVHYADSTSTGTTGRFIWENNEMIGYPCFSTNQMSEALTVGTATCSGLILGAFSQMMIAFWGNAQEILIDPYSLSKSGGVRIMSFVDVDVELRNATAFTRVIDAQNTL